MVEDEKRNYSMINFVYTQENSLNLNFKDFKGVNAYIISEEDFKKGIKYIKNKKNSKNTPQLDFHYFSTLNEVKDNSN